MDKIVLPHEKLISATGGSPDLRDRGLLEGAVYSVNNGFEEEEESYPTIEEKAARFAYDVSVMNDVDPAVKISLDEWKTLREEFRFDDTVDYKKTLSRKKRLLG